MRSPHRLADPIVVILSSVATAPLDLRRLTLIDPDLPGAPFFTGFLPPTRYAAVAENAAGNPATASPAHGRAA
jgi:hypothetical protein